MRSHLLTSAACVACWVASAFAQAPLPPPPVVAAPVPLAPASDPPKSRTAMPDPARRLSPPEVSAEARSPDERLARPVLPQVAIPLGRSIPGREAGTPPRRLAAPPSRAASGVIDDAAARCESTADAGARAACRRQADRISLPPR